MFSLWIDELRHPGMPWPPSWPSILYPSRSCKQFVSHLLLTEKMLWWTLITGDRGAIIKKLMFPSFKRDSSTSTRLQAGNGASGMRLLRLWVLSMVVVILSRTWVSKFLRLLTVQRQREPKNCSSIDHEFHRSSDVAINAIKPEWGQGYIDKVWFVINISITGHIMAWSWSCSSSHDKHAPAVHLWQPGWWMPSRFRKLLILIRSFLLQFLHVQGHCIHYECNMNDWYKILCQIYIPVIMSAIIIFSKLSMPENFHLFTTCVIDKLTNLEKIAGSTCLPSTLRHLHLVS